MAFPPAAVTLEPAKMVPIEDATEYVATLKSLRSTAIQPQIDGQITGIFVKPGDRVRAGDRLVQIDPSRQQAAVSTQEAERAARDASVAFARQQQQRAAELYHAGAISQQELEQAETTLRTAEAGLQSLQAQVQQEQVQLRYFTVTAPTGGIIGDVPARIGNLVSPQTILTTIDQNETLEVNVQIPIDRSDALKSGLPLRILNGDGGTVVGETTINFISPRVDEQTQSVLVKGLLRNPDLALRASQFVRARIVWKTGEGLVIPVTAAMRINGQYFAFVGEESKGPDGKTALVAKQRPIKIGSIVGENYAVLDGLNAGDRVVVSGVQKLADGAPIVPAQ
jgi:RND family efflux transporter MFP subunit